VPLLGFVVACGLLGTAGLSGTTASAAQRPSERTCLLAWNGLTNKANRLRVVTGGPWSGASLLPATIYTTTWKDGSPPKQTKAQACLLRLVKSERSQVVTGKWRNGGVARWSFGRVTAVGKVPGSNVKLLPDGRMTKLYLR
jgi:hypothetical protein